MKHFEWTGAGAYNTIRLHSQFSSPKGFSDLDTTHHPMILFQQQHLLPSADSSGQCNSKI